MRFIAKLWRGQIGLVCYFTRARQRLNLLGNAVGLFTNLNQRIFFVTPFQFFLAGHRVLCTVLPNQAELLLRKMSTLSQTLPPLKFTSFMREIRKTWISFLFYYLFHHKNFGAIAEDGGSDLTQVMCSFTITMAVTWQCSYVMKFGLKSSICVPYIT